MLRSTDRIILLTLPLLLFLLFAGYKNDRLFYILFLKNASNLNTIGVFKKTDGDVRKRQNQGFIWTTVNSGDSLSGKDTVFVGDKGHAQIVLDKDINVEIQENSLLTVYGDGSAPPTLSLSSGAIKASSVSGKEINLKGRYTESQTVALSSKESEFKSKEPSQQNSTANQPKSSPPAKEEPKSKSPEEIAKQAEDEAQDEKMRRLFIGLGLVYLVVILILVIDAKFGKKRRSEDF